MGSNGQGKAITEFIDTVDLDDESSRDQLYQLVVENFEEARRSIFHYSLWVHNLNAQGKLRGGYSAAEQGNNPTFLVALGDYPIIKVA